MPEIINPDLRYVDACRQEVYFTSGMTEICLELFRYPQSAASIIAGGRHPEPLPILLKMWEGFLVIPKLSPPSETTMWWITGRGQSILNARVQELRDRENGNSTGKPILVLRAP